MKLHSFLFTFFIALFSSVSLAGTGHDHGSAHEPVTQQQAEQAASRIVANLVNQGVIDKSWQDKPVKNSEKKEFGGRMEWVVSYDNPAVSDPQKRILYIFLTLGGGYIAANYTGE